VIRRRRGFIKPPKRTTRCPDCRGRVLLFVRSNGSGWDHWRCSNLRGCGTSGTVLPDGALAVTERFLVRHPTPVFDLGVRTLPRIVAAGLQRGGMQ
jgi:hypothetical protein